jgi:hypothetical protein
MAVSVSRSGPLSTFRRLGVSLDSILPPRAGLRAVWPIGGVTCAAGVGGSRLSMGGSSLIQASLLVRFPRGSKHIFSGRYANVSLTSLFGLATDSVWNVRLKRLKPVSRSSYFH